VSEVPLDIAPAARYRQALEQGRLDLQRCESCHSAVFPPRVLCPVCSSESLAWETSSRAGTVYSTSTLAPRDEPPYTVVLVDLDEGPRVMAVAVGAHERIGARTILNVENAADGVPRLVASLGEGLT
jgi:uncharacterized OB-fold protein